MKTQYKHIGQVDFVDNRVNQQNWHYPSQSYFFQIENNQLIPGLFAHLKLVGSKSYQGILIDEKAIGTGLK